MWPSTTNAFAPLSLKPLPERTACSLVCSGRCFAPSSIASAASSEPSEIFGRCAAFCASLPPRVSADAASTAVERNGDGISVRPISSITTPASTQPSPLPPKFSGTSRPEKPISANAFQSSRENPVASLHRASCRRCDTGALSLIRPRALSRSMDCSSVRTSAIERSSGQMLTMNFVVRRSGMRRRRRPGIRHPSSYGFRARRFATRPDMPAMRMRRLKPPADRGCAWRRCRASPRRCRLRSNWPWCAARRADGRRPWSARFPIPAHRRRRPTSGFRSGAC